MKREFLVTAIVEGGHERVCFLIEADALKNGILVNNTYRRVVPVEVTDDLIVKTREASKWAHQHHYDAVVLAATEQAEKEKLNARARAERDELERKALVQSRAEAKERTETPSRMEY